MSEMELGPQSPLPHSVHIGYMRGPEVRQEPDMWEKALSDIDSLLTTSEDDEDTEDIDDDMDGSQYGDDELDHASFCSLTHGQRGLAESRRLLRGMARTATGYVCANAVLLIDLAFIGHLDTEDLAAMNLANVVMFGSLVFVTGVCNALAGLCTQAYEVAKDFVKDGSKSKAEYAYSRVGLMLQVALVWISLVLLPPTAIAWYFTGDILDAFGACEPVVCAKSALFARLSILWLWPYAIFTMISIYLESIEVVAPQSIIGMIFVAINVALDYVFIYGLGPLEGLGFTGSPIATAVSRIIQLAVLVLYVWGGYTATPPQVSRTWHGWSYRAFSWQRGIDFMLEGLPFGLTEVLSDWVFEIVIILGGTLGTVQAAAVGTLINMIVFFQPLFISLYMSLQSRVDKNLCNSNPLGARRTFACGLQIALMAGLLVSVLIVLFRHVLAQIYTEDPAVIEMFVSLTPIAALHYLLSGITFTFQGVLEGQYRIQVVIAGTILGSWGTGIAGMTILIFGMHYRVHALWWALCVGEAVHSIILLMVLSRTHWQEEAEKSVQRAMLVEAQYDVIAEECEQSMILISGKGGSNYGANSTSDSYDQLSDIHL